jgi:hypothetical protein
LSIGQSASGQLACNGRVFVDATHGRILDLFDLLIYRRTRSHAIDQVKDINIVDRNVGTSGRYKPGHAVQIQFKTGKPVTVAFEDDMEDAKALPPP